ncbi:hypothetical protein GCM10025787_48790 [Saccharopolyspora rosea]|uniref:YncE family protein n=1 Tax=Saccharopolyspora rosea TaxID=524884 RepID=A0ABW3G0C2_9PSEU
MNERNSTRDEDLVRTQLHRFVEDVEPSPDALPRVLAAARRRRSPRRNLVLAAGAAVTATAAFLVALLVIPDGRDAEPVSVQPNSYLASPTTGVIASFDVLSGHENREIARIAGARAGVLAADGDRAYTAVDDHGRIRIVEVWAGGRRVVGEVPGTDRPVLAANAGRVAYVDGNAVTVLRGQQRRSIPVPPGLRVHDLALAPDGRLAVLAGPPDSPRSSVSVVAPAGMSLDGRPEATPPDGCGPLAVTWSGHDLAALQPVDCSGQVRVATFDSDSGRQLGAGVPFRAGPLVPDSVQLSTDRLGRFLISTGATGQWLVDGSVVRQVPPACSAGGACAGTPGTFWG